MRGSVDRIEADKIIIIFDDKKIIEVDKTLFPELKEGDRIVEENNIIKKDNKDTLNQKKIMSSLQNKLFRRRLNGKK